MDEADLERRKDAKLFNERLKLRGTLFNNLGIAVFVAMVVAPIASGRHLSVWLGVMGFLSVVVLHLVAQVVLRPWKSED